MTSVKVKTVGHILFLHGVTLKNRNSSRKRLTNFQFSTRIGLIKKHRHRHLNNRNQTKLKRSVGAN